jgi:hypothetical protein
MKRASLRVRSPAVSVAGLAGLADSAAATAPASRAVTLVPHGFPSGFSLVAYCLDGGTPNAGAAQSMLIPLALMGPAHFSISRTTKPAR